MIKFFITAFLLFDILGSFERHDLYQALIVDAPNNIVAGQVLDVAHHDPKITSTQFVDLHEVYLLNF